MPGIVDLAVEDALGVDVSPAGKAHDQHDAQGEQRREDHAHAGVLRDLAQAGDRLREHARQHAQDHRPQEHRPAGELAGEQERDGQAGQHGVADGVAQEAHPPQDQVAAEQRTARRCVRMPMAIVQSGVAKSAHMERLAGPQRTGHLPAERDQAQTESDRQIGQQAEPG